MNSRYSLMAFAKFLNMDSSSLSAILKGKRPLSLSKGLEICIKLAFGEIDKNIFLRSLESEHIKLYKIPHHVRENVEFSLEDDIKMRLMLHWEYFAIYALLATLKRPVQADYVGKRLGLEAEVALECMEDLVSLKLVERKSEGFIKTGSWVKLKSSNEYELILACQRDLFNLLFEREHEMDQDNSFFTSMTISSDPQKLDGAKKSLQNLKVKWPNI